MLVGIVSLSLTVSERAHFDACHFLLILGEGGQETHRGDPVSVHHCVLLQCKVVLLLDKGRIRVELTRLVFFFLIVRRRWIQVDGKPLDGLGDINFDRT